jgi:AcrR family transcriptional regulator
MASVEGRAEEGHYHHGDLRRALLGSALHMLEEGEELSLRAVARRAGVSHTAPYHHFADRRALLAAVAEEGLLALRDALRAAVETAPGELEEQLLETGVAYVRFAVGSPARFRLMFSAELADRADRPSLQAASEAAYGVLLETVQRCFGEGIPGEAVELRALAAWSTVHGLSMLVLDSQVPGIERTPEAAGELARRVLSAGGAPSSGSLPPAG